MLIVTGGAGAKTKTQCLRVKDRYIYAAQFHMEMEGTPENSRRIMSNFLTRAKEWGGYNPRGTGLSPPPAWR
jgi:GMP synthase-like glutamine amidotransferase